MDWAISSCLVVFLSSTLSLFTDGTKLSSHINRVLGLICLLTVFSPLVNSIKNGEFFNITDDILPQNSFLVFIENSKKDSDKNTIINIINKYGISNYNLQINYLEEENVIQSIVISLDRANQNQISSITDEISKKLMVDERIILIC